MRNDFVTLVDAIPQMIWVASSTGEAEYQNHRLLEYMGLPPRGVRGGDWATVIHPDDLPAVTAAWSRAVRTGATFEAEYRVRRHDGAYRWHLSRSVRTATNGVVRWYGTLTDIEDRKRAEAEAARAADLLRAVCDGTTDAVFVKDLDGRYLLCNPAAARFMGRPVGDVLGRIDVELFELDGARLIRSRDLAVMTAGRPETADETVRADGVTRTYHASKAPYRDAAGRVIGVVGVSRDVTAHRRDDAALRLFRALLDRASDAIEVIDPGTGRFLDVNERACRDAGYTRDEYLAMCVADVDPLVALRPWPQVMAGVRAAPRVFESVHRRKDGSTFPVEVAADVIRLDREYVVAVVRDITERRAEEERLRLQNRAIEAVTQGVLISDATAPDTPIVYVSAGFERLTGYAAAEVLGRNCRFLHGPDTDPTAVAHLNEAIRSGSPRTVELLNYRKDGTAFWNEVALSPVRDAAGELSHFVKIQTDVTTRRELERQYRQSQKMEAVGLLAGGIAHDFNNILTVINSYADVLQQIVPADGPARELLAEILAAGERAANLTRRLLTFGRRQVLQPQVLDLNALVTDLERMLARLLGEDLRLVLELDPALEPALADPGQVEQVLMNLAVNARDAMPEGGVLTIGTAAVEPTAARPDRRVRLSVSDTGCGMTDAVKARIFEPFFTTKEPGKGTGLGLATVFGIVEQSGGHIEVDSAVGRGTTVKVFLPVGAGDRTEGARQAPPPEVARGRETVLLVEDEPSVRALTARILCGAGYTVLEAGGRDEAVRAFSDTAGTIDLLFTDVVMPGGNGRLLAEQLSAEAPELRVLYMSGYPDAVARHGIHGAEVAFLHKPFTAEGLLNAVRRVLDVPPTGHRGRTVGGKRHPSASVTVAE